MATSPTLEARGLVKHFGGVQALRGADFDVYAGEIVALIGDNGAGKSTLVKTLSGVHRPDEGEIRIDGKVMDFHSPQDAQGAGVYTVYQDLALPLDLDAASCLYLGREIVRKGPLGWFGVLDNKAMKASADAELMRLGVNLKDSAAPLASLSGGQRQSVAAARASLWGRKVVFFDEPTAALGVVQTARVLELLRRIKDQGLGVVLISHSMPDVLAVADRIHVLRLGRNVRTYNGAETTTEELVGAMTGALEDAPAEKEVR
ncbi:MULTISPECIES: ATP-binding cassette domain-containing protein [unclassified Mycolicibacterium]|uniref:ATP-binding cassette domain-containing protein n=1 Tax=unclassified Mycolicibacterium TaxID=2636767 RepID=UPI001F4BF9F4|nr:ATP-binding cassette domain-containing protein [Mycolicibacterium sp. YH-1]UNB52067.1 ATP-binding cassette domain-containing protein [Mycolicibacterium sp. YH-1]